MAGVVIHTFLVDGVPEGLRTYEISNATILCTAFPRLSLKRFLQREPSGRPGVYFLIGPSEDVNKPDMIYIGQGEPVGARFNEHVTKKDFWNEAVVFTSKDAYLTKTQIQYLEAVLIERAQQGARVALDNNKSEKRPAISEPEQAAIEGFLESLLLLLRAAGFDFLRSWDEPVKETQGDGEIFYFKVKDAEARMIRSDSSYVVLKGSTAPARINASAGDWVVRLRNQLTDAKILVPTKDSKILRFESNAAFASPSSAAAVVNGGNKNGQLAWKLSDGRTLRDVEAAASKAAGVGD